MDTFFLARSFIVYTLLLHFSFVQVAHMYLYFIANLQLVRLRLLIAKIHVSALSTHVDFFKVSMRFWVIRINHMYFFE